MLQRCFRLQRYKLLKAIHNAKACGIKILGLFQTTKIQTFESNSQRRGRARRRDRRCFRLQRYKLLKAIHNARRQLFQELCGCFRLQRYKLLKAIHNNRPKGSGYRWVVSDYKDTNFWKQFTTRGHHITGPRGLFQTTKIQTFESNSQQRALRLHRLPSCFRLQRYKLLKAIHNLEKIVYQEFRVVSDYKDTNFWKQFTTVPLYIRRFISCFRLQRYKLLKAIHNTVIIGSTFKKVVSDYKDTNFWKQFTTILSWINSKGTLFQTTKIQTFESNSQPTCECSTGWVRCFRLQRYKLLKAIHNEKKGKGEDEFVVSDYKDTNFWKQFTTDRLLPKE